MGFEQYVLQFLCLHLFFINLYMTIKNFKSFNKIYIFKGSYLGFFIKNFDILKKKYDYLILYDGKKRSHIISFFIRGKKISLSKSKNLFKCIKN